MRHECDALLEFHPGTSIPSCALNALSHPLRIWFLTGVTAQTLMGGMGLRGNVPAW